jgi:hypothetical protein
MGDGEGGGWSQRGMHPIFIESLRSFLNLGQIPKTELSNLSYIVIACLD